MDRSYWTEEETTNTTDPTDRTNGQKKNWTRSIFFFSRSLFVSGRGEDVVTARYGAYKGSDKSKGERNKKR